MSEHGIIAGKTCVITGGASGLGALYAEEFLKGGAKRVAILDIAEEVGKATAARLNDDYPDKAVFFKCDSGDEEQITKVFEQVVAEFKQVDVIVNNAGIMSDWPTAWRKACDVNWQGVVSLTMKGVKHMRKDEGGAGGTIINISSTGAMFRMRQMPIYGGSKAAVLHFSQSIAMDPFNKETGIRVLTFCPGPTETALLKGLKYRAYDDKTGDELVEFDNATKAESHQTPASAAAAFVVMFKEGANGSVWLSQHNKPVRDITPTIERIYKELETLVIP